MRKISFLFFLLATNLSAQDFMVAGQISAIKKSGLHTLQLPNTIRSYAKQGLDDVRILDSNGNQVPYFSFQEHAETRVTDFVEFEIISNKIVKDRLTSVVFKNPFKKINKILFEIENYDGSKSISIEGSYDQKQWFGVLSEKKLTGLNAFSSTSAYKVVDIPLSSYRYFKVVFNDVKTRPIHILKIGKASYSVKKHTMDALMPASTHREEIETSTAFRFNFENPEVINSLQLNITTPKYYKRNASLFVKKTILVKGKEQQIEKVLKRFVIDSEKELTYSIAQILTNEIYIKIENEDNPPIGLTSIQFFQKPLYLVADLLQTETYKVVAGNPLLNAPRYDLTYFKNTISNKLPKATIILIKKNTSVQNKSDISFWQQSWFMWMCIGAASIMIAYVVKNLVSDLKL